MKKATTILMLVVTLLLGGMTAEAKTSSKKKTTSSSSLTLKKMEDGYADVSGHTYKATMKGDYMKIHFGKDGYATFSGNGFKSFKMFWSYQGNGVVSTFLDGSESLDFDIEDDGKNLRGYNGDEYLNFKLIK